jgi:predicted PurR-regulated permease PerM
MQTKIIERYFFFGLLLATLVFTFFIFQPFWIVIILGIAFSVVFYPVYEWFNRRKLPHWLSSLLTVIIFTIILLGPVLGIGAIVFNQSQDAYFYLVTGGNSGTFIDSVETAVNKILPDNVNFDASQKISDFVFFITNNIAKIFSSTLSAFFSFTLMLLAMFYFFKDGHEWKKTLIKLSPLRDEDDTKIIRKLTNAINGVVKGYLLIGLLQGTLMGVGLWIVGIPNPALWGVVAAVASLIPMVGTGFVSVPAIIYLLATGETGTAIALLAWSVTLVGTIDNMLNPYLIGGKINLPPLLVLISVLGGISLLGPVGILVGPLTLSLLYTLISIYKNEFKDSQQEV